MLRFLLTAGPRPSARALIPHLTFLLVFLAMRGDVTVAGATLPAAGTAVMVYVTIVILQNLRRLRAQPLPLRLLFHVAVLLIGVAAVGLWAPAEIQVQESWVIAATLFALAFAGFAFFGDEHDIASLPTPWARGKSPHKQQALALVAGRHAFDAMLAAVLMRWASLDTWIGFVSVGRLVTWYITEWLIFVMLVRRAAP